MKFSKAAVDAIAKGSKYKAKPEENPPLPLVPEEGEYDNDSSKMGLFKLLSNPTDANSAAYKFTMGYTDGTQSIHYHIQWVKNVNKVLSGMNITTGIAQRSMVEQLCSGPVLTAFKDYILHKQKKAHVAQARTAASTLGSHDPMVETVR